MTRREDEIRFESHRPTGEQTPTQCKSGECFARTQAPVIDGWTYVTMPTWLDIRTGWWCPTCTTVIREVINKNKAAFKQPKRPTHHHHHRWRH